MKSPGHIALRGAVCISALWVAAGAAAPSQQQSGLYDLVIRAGLVMDPESGFDRIANVGVEAGTIRAVSSDPLQGRRTIDAAGLVVSPGFIDLDSYARLARFQVGDGVTTMLDLRDGTDDVDRWYAELGGKMPINFGVGVGYMPVRTAVMGQGDTSRERAVVAPPPELEQILIGIERGLNQGAVGVGMGSSRFTGPPHWELLETFRLAARAGAHVDGTVWSMDWTDDVPAQLSEVIGAAAVTGAALHIPHLGSTAGPQMPRLLEMIAMARARGMHVTAEVYPYRAATGLVRPGEARAWTDDEIREVQVIETGERLTRTGYERFADREIRVIFHNESLEPVVAQAVSSPLVSIASHAYLDARLRGHPRTAGTFSRVLGHYVRERRVLSLMDALRKMTLMPAQRLEARVPEMRNKGRIRVGADADIVVFDADRIIDRASFKDPTLAPEGIDYVLVNGIVVIDQGRMVDGVYPGRPIRAAQNQPR